MIHRVVRSVLAMVLLAAGLLTGSLLTAGSAHADGCYTWNRTLAQGASGGDVSELQIRVAGYPGYGGVLGIDGDFGPATKAAVTRFQQAYGLPADGVAGSSTYNKLYSLQDDDCTPLHFSYAELNDCNTTWAGGAVSSGTAKSNALRTMWKLEAMRHALGDAPITVTSGFRSTACNDAVGGATGSRHLYGDAADLGRRPALALQARTAGAEPRVQRHPRPGLPGPQRPRPRRPPSGPLLVCVVLRNLTPASRPSTRSPPPN